MSNHITSKVGENGKSSEKQKYGEKCPSIQSRTSLVASPTDTMHSYAKNKATIVDISPENTPLVARMQMDNNNT